jgi:hypothetical protein
MGDNHVNTEQNAPMELAPAVETMATSLAADQSRAVMEVQGQIIMARKFPRDTVAAYTRIIDACKRKGLAERAMYAYTRGKETVKGPSIRLAEEMARAYGNIDCGWRILSEDKVTGKSEIEAFAWDLESNYRPRITFTVRHWRDTKSGGYRLKDERDIYELCANMAARRLRACLLKVLPSDVVEDALAQVSRTLSGDGEAPLQDRVRKMVAAFSNLGVTQEMIETKLDHALDATTPDELVDMLAIFNTLRQGEKRPADFFEVPSVDQAASEATSSLIDAVKGGE